MADVKEQLDQIDKKVMKGLKDFQQATVERIDYLYRHGQRRVLVSDEVGLGKTLIARGVVAKTAKIRRDENDDLFRVVYICSNGAIAEQNLRKLRITQEAKTESVLSSRLSMQHLNIYHQDYDKDLRQRYIQLIPLTPDTSFRVTNGGGTYKERALMYAILWRIPELEKYKEPLNDIMKYGARASWDWARDNYEAEVENCNSESGGKYLQEMVSSVSHALNQHCDERETYLDKLLLVCRAAEYGDRKWDKEWVIIGKLRMIFARISLEKLNPDLVIMDEFQRFKFLLDAKADSDIGMLTQKFFHSKDVRMLLLSATPYKMYSTPEEIDEDHIDQHYTEFLTVMNFLNETPDQSNDLNEKRKNQFLSIWRNYSVQLRELTLDDLSILSAKHAAEDAMYQSVCRTERISESRSADMINDESVRVPVSVTEQDILSFVQAQKLFDDIGLSIHVPVDYVKSTPYLMSFMRDYQLKRMVESYFKKNPDQISKIRRSTFWLNRNAMDRYEKIPTNNARLEQVINIVLQKGMEKLLWIPPSRPYYELQGAFKGCDDATKTLAFSSWEMVPRMLACMISYESERKTVGSMISDYQERNVHYFAGDEKRYPPPRLRFSVNTLTGEPRAMTLFCLLYPSEFLTEVYDPIRTMNEGMKLSQIRREIKEKIAERLERFPSPDRGQEDAKWYYIAPLLLDNAEYAFHWLEENRDLADNDDEENKKKGQKGYLAHLDALTELFYQTHREKVMNLGKQPRDLYDTLTDMALASPAVCIRRTFLKYTIAGQELSNKIPGSIAKVFINRMNTPESIAAVELTCGRKNKEDAHWQNLLTYCMHGNLQAVFDEYAHLVSSGIDQDESMLNQMYIQIKEAMDIRATSYDVDTFNSFKRRMNGKKGERSSVRTHFAVAFTKGENRESDADRKRTIRNAFNSPFRPFVLATTSIGQEGLDFHQYCRRIVHWNLPANPIDLEQREGRINRFECLAIRQNIAKRYGNSTFSGSDIWKEMFAAATEREKTDGSSDLIPYWGLTEQNDMVRIERIVPMYPFSRDETAYKRLIKILSLYRLTLGQARQEELLEYLFQNCDDPEKLKEFFINLSPFFKRNR